mmetsp:Transcript_6463/g.19124  ORF Transcript_6463/g.19124 Transcript_6463/m.19124 type:complete len:282 (+) Transcript_6463:565-1410(+)
MNATWKLASSSFSNSAASSWLEEASFFPSSPISAMHWRALSSSSTQPSLVVSLSSTLIFTSFGVKAANSTWLAIRAIAALSRLSGTPKLAAYKFAEASTNAKCASSLGSNWIGLGGRLGPLQNSVPSEVLWSSGNVCNNCAIESWNLSWNSCTPNLTHMSKGPERCSSMRRMQPIFVSWDVPVPSEGNFARYAAGSVKKLLTSRGLSTNNCSNKSRAHSMVCSMAWGKCFNVHNGIDSSGGSCESPYDCVRSGNTTCTLAFVPKVPDSSSGLANHTQREST